MGMEAAIKEELKKLEDSEKVKVIMAVESGSRAWGFPSPDSDYDVRFIYVRNQADYLRLDAVGDVIEWKLDEVLDIPGGISGRLCDCCTSRTLHFLSGVLPRSSTKRQKRHSG